MVSAEPASLAARYLGEQLNLLFVQDAQSVGAQAKGLEHSRPTSLQTSSEDFRHHAIGLFKFRENQVQDGIARTRFLNERSVLSA